MLCVNVGVCVGDCVGDVGGKVGTFVAAREGACVVTDCVGADEVMALDGGTSHKAPLYPDMHLHRNAAPDLC